MDFKNKQTLDALLTKVKLHFKIIVTNEKKKIPKVNAVTKLQISPRVLIQTLWNLSSK